MRAILIRHAESSGQEPDAGLTPRGLAQAEELAAALRHESIGRLVSSPFRRACQTAGPFAARMELRIDARLAEWQLPWVPDSEWPQALRSVFSSDIPLPVDVEARAAARSRGLAVLNDAAAITNGVAALVTHGKLLALVLGELMGGDPFEVFMTLRSPHAFEVRASRSGFEVRSLWHPSV